MIFTRAWFALMRRNVVYRRRNLLGTTLEIVLPIAFVSILLAIKSSVENTSSFKPTIVEAKTPDNDDVFIPLSFTDYVTALQAKRQCVWRDGDDMFDISGMPLSAYNWQVPMIKCDPLKCQRDGEDAHSYCEFGIVAIAGAGDTGKQRALDLKNYILDRWPVLQDPTAIPVDYDLVQIFESASDMDDYVKRAEYGFKGFPKIVMGIVWDEGNDGKSYSYSLRQNSTNINNPTTDEAYGVQTTPETTKKFASYARNDAEACELTYSPSLQGDLAKSCTGQYIYNGVLTFQRLVGDFILKHSGAVENGYFVAESGVRYVPFPSRQYEEQGFYGSISDFAAPLLMVLGLLYPLASMISYITNEKELRQKELLKMMSVVESDIGWAWFVTFFLSSILTATLTSLVANSLYVSSDGLLMWIFWMLTFLNIIVFSMLMSALTSKSTRGVLIGLLVFFLGFFIALFVDYTKSSSVGLVSLHPVAAFTYGIQEIGRLEDLGIGITSSSISATDSPSGYTFQNILAALMLDSFLWGVLGWYLNRVIRPDYGQAHPLWFPFTVAYWFPGRERLHLNDSDDGLENLADVPVEPVGESLQRQSKLGENIQIRGLSKVFGDHTAVDNLNLTMYNGQITALLGHNGAGKTTTIGILTGALSPTSGTAIVRGKDIRSQMNAIRQDVGICLQHDCLFPQLTVREHVQFFSRLKGLYSEMSYQDAEAHVDQAIRDVALFEKRNTLSKNLSGGMKRKLSVAIAFCGGSKVVLLDEPTSGMDPFSRRFTWNVIREYRRDRCIILTTHFMDEADILGDRIAIMAEGQLRCAGSALFLKKTYGVGYQLTIEKLKKDKNGTGESNHGTNCNDSHRLKELVHSAVPEATLLSDVGSELSYQLPLGAASKFGPLLQRLDQEVDQSEVSSYGVSVTTLEEVFLLVARDGSTEHKEFASSKRGNFLEADVSKSARSKMDLENDGLFARHIGALFWKRAAFFRRDKRAWVFTSLVPSFFVFVGFLIMTVTDTSRPIDPLTLRLEDYNSDMLGGQQNPIPFNSPRNPFVCQPGKCAYDFDVIAENGTNELYHFCGSQARMAESAMCSISESVYVTQHITDAGAVPMEMMVETILQSSQRLFNSSAAYGASQYGAIFFTHDQSSVVVNGSASQTYKESTIDACLNMSSDYSPVEDCYMFGGIGYVIQYNFTALHVSPLYQALADEALLREAMKDDAFNIQCTIAPLPITRYEETLNAADNAYPAWILVVLSFPFITGAFASFVVAERESKAKHLQTVAGVVPSAYWISTFLWDVLNYQIPLWITVALIFAFDVDVLTSTEGDAFSGLLTILFLYGPASAGYAYCAAYGFKSPSACNVVLIISGFLIGMGGPMTVFTLKQIAHDANGEKDYLMDAANIVSWCLRWVPSYCLGQGIFNAVIIDLIRQWEADPSLTVWSPQGVQLEVDALVFQSVVYLLLAILLDIWSTKPRIMSFWYNFMRIITCRCSRDGARSSMSIALPEDDDVMAEQSRVLSGEASDELIVINQLTKVYDDGKVAVNALSLGIPHGECFGLLGINGAGKTTTMGMLTAEFPPTSGDAFLAGYSVSNEPEKTRRRIGYCPQFDAHFANLTGREHVELYASIKGVPRAFVKEAAAAKLKSVGLTDADADRLSSGYSGGMKRRLSLACASIGQPQILFLDECSTGVDPVARREIWQLISDMVVGGKNVPEDERTSVILTTHSMEECEALCSRIGIMANGRLRCLGSALHLKNKFGKGYQVELKLHVTDRQDEDYKAISEALLEAKGINPSATNLSSAIDNDDTCSFTLQEAIDALDTLTKDTFLSDMVNTDNPSGYTIWKEATSDVGVPLDALAAFATTELRMGKVENFMKQTYPNHILRERQETKCRYEVTSDGLRLSTLFATIEANKESLHLSDYSVSQTSLEQVFNMHAAEAEKMKEDRQESDPVEHRETMRETLRSTQVPSAHSLIEC